MSFICSYAVIFMKAKQWLDEKRRNPTQLSLEVD